jgi:hypothetical protein
MNVIAFAFKHNLSMEKARAIEEAIKTSYWEEYTVEDGWASDYDNVFEDFNYEDYVQVASLFNWTYIWQKMKKMGADMEVSRSTYDQVRNALTQIYSEFRPKDN